VNFELTAEQRLLQATSRAWFSKHFQPADMRRLLDNEASAGNGNAGLAETGYLGALIGAEHHGGGLSLLELALICEEAGRVLADVPLIATAAHAAGILLACGERSPSVLAAIATGGEVAAVIEARDAVLDRETCTVTAHCPAAFGAELAASLVVVHEDRVDPWVAVVRADAKGVTREARRPIDPTRRLARVSCDHAPAELLCEGKAATRSIESGFRKALVALAAEDLGAATACLDASITYAKERHAFGRPIGSFQAIKHMCVDAYIAIEQLRTLVWYAGWCEAGEPLSFPMAASAARSYAAETLEKCVETQIQVHGGLGVTWEHDAHLYWRRAQVDKVMLGDAVLHRELVGQAALNLARDQGKGSFVSEGTPPLLAPMSRISSG
jgi:alkylation response protein AidB-like acyl-CoA dehydrogenase